MKAPGRFRTIRASARWCRPTWLSRCTICPGFPLGSVILREGVFTAAVGSLVLRFEDRSSHASEPEQGVSPIGAIMRLLQVGEALSLNRPESSAFQRVTPVHVRVGESAAYGVTPGGGEVHLTLRAWDDVRLEGLYESLLAAAGQEATRDGLTLTAETLQRFASNVNSPELVRAVRAAASVAGLDSMDLPSPIKAGEDFGLFGSRFPACLFGLGAGEETPALHSPDYDFPDSLIGSGVSLFRGLIDGAVGSESR